MKTTRYFDTLKNRPDRAQIRAEWIQFVISNPEKEQGQKDGRIRKWVKIKDMGDCYMRVIPLQDGETVHNAFFDRSFRP